MRIPQPFGSIAPLGRLHRPSKLKQPSPAPQSDGGCFFGYTHKPTLTSGGHGTRTHPRNPGI